MINRASLCLKHLPVLVALPLAFACAQEGDPAAGGDATAVGSGSSSGTTPGGTATGGATAPGSGSTTAGTPTAPEASGGGVTAPDSSSGVNTGSVPSSTGTSTAGAGTGVTPGAEPTSSGSSDPSASEPDPTVGPDVEPTPTDTTEPVEDPTEDPMAGAGGAPTDEPVMGAGGAGGMAPVEEDPGEGAATPCGAAGLGFCTDFEVDALPAELAFYPEYLRENVANYVTIDSTQAHSGTRSAKVVGNEFSQMLGVATPGPSFWGRVYLMSDTDIQNGHNTYVAATDSDGDPNNGEHIRIGEHQCQLEVNRKSDDAEQLSNGGTYMCTGGFVMLANTWYCLEFHYDGPGSELSVFVDGTEIPELHNTTWGPYQYSLFKFGFEKYHGQNKTLWYDDVALGSERIGCFD